jgi:poly-gamma-glutamate synthesis protein (capsule biosynthesis protein)
MTEVRTLAFLGDLMLGRKVSMRLRERPPEWFWGDVLPLLRDCDGAIANLECPITSCSEKWQRSWKFFHFRADPAAVGILIDGHVGGVCLANNHMLDFGEAGLADTVRHLDAAGIVHAGAGKNAVEAAAPAYLDLTGLKVGLIAATDNMRPFAAGDERPGTNFVEIDGDARTLAWIERSVTQMRQYGARLIVLSLHWGPNMRLAPRQRFRRFARAAVECGVDVIHGHSAHVVHAVERHGDGLILYDTGNFIDDYWKFPFRQTTTSFAFLLDIEDGRLARLRLVPVHVHSPHLELATGKAREAIKRRMAALCRDVGTMVADRGDRLEISLD